MLYDLAIAKDNGIDGQYRTSNFQPNACFTKLNKNKKWFSSKL